MNKHVEEENGFGLRDTNVAKGFFVLIMVFHHVFYPDVYWYIKNLAEIEPTVFMEQACRFAKVCVGGFSFLSAYGITKKCINNKESDIKICITRVVKLYFSFWPIFIVGIIGTLLFGEKSILDIYVNSYNQNFSWILMVADMLGFAYPLKTGTLNVTWWYLSVALYLVFAVPLYNKLHTRFGWLFAVVMCMLPYVTEVEPAILLFVIPTLGIVFARENIFERMKSFYDKKIWKMLLAGGMTVVGLCVAFELTTAVEGLRLMLPVSTIACILFSYIVLSNVPILNRILEFFGKHATNIFLIHAFFCYEWFAYTVYSLKNGFFIYGAVFVASLMVSMVLEALKKLFRYYKFQSWVIHKLYNKFDSKGES